MTERIKEKPSIGAYQWCPRCGALMTDTNHRCHGSELALSDDDAGKLLHSRKGPNMTERITELLKDEQKLCQELAKHCQPCPHHEISPDVAWGCTECGLAFNLLLPGLCCQGTIEQWAFRARDMACGRNDGDVLSVQWHNALRAVFDAVNTVPHREFDFWFRTYATPRHWIIAAIIALEHGLRKDNSDGK